LALEKWLEKKSLAQRFSNGPLLGRGSGDSFAEESEEWAERQMLIAGVSSVPGEAYEGRQQAAWETRRGKNLDPFIPLRWSSDPAMK
jgi:hypothetical protein